MFNKLKILSHSMKCVALKMINKPVGFRNFADVG